MDSLYGIMHGLAVAAQPTHLLYTLIGVFIGTMISHLPGIGPSAGIALLIPVTFGMDPATALMMLAGIYYGCMYGGAVTAILLNTPGDAAAVMTVLDGYPLARKGRAAPTLAIAAVSSFIAGTIGVTALAFIAVPLAAIALHFGPAEYFALILFALTTVSALTGDSIAKGMLATFIGLAISTVGIDLQTGTPRFTMGLVELQDRVSFLVVVVGLFALAEVSRMVEGTLQGTMHVVKVKGRLWFTREDWRRARPAIFRGTAIGFFCGAAPGLGGTIAAMLAYIAEKKVSKRPEEFGHGAIEGVCAPEAATNADTCGAFVHLLALGVPGSGSTAMIMGAFIMYGIQPGPMLFTTHPDLVWGLIASMYLGNMMLVVLNQQVRHPEGAADLRADPRPHHRAVVSPGDDDLERRPDDLPEEPHRRLPAAMRGGLGAAVDLGEAQRRRCSAAPGRAHGWRGRNDDLVRVAAGFLLRWHVRDASEARGQARYRGTDQDHQEQPHGLQRHDEGDVGRAAGGDDGDRIEAARARRKIGGQRIDMEQACQQEG
jgi:putative tricarboxylic transport membrane protein